MRESWKEWFAQPKRGCNMAATYFPSCGKGHVLDYIIISKKKIALEKQTLRQMKL
jgi:hypothetical protein